MPVQNYGLLKGEVVGSQRGSDQSPHYQIHVRAAGTDYRIAVNVRSQTQPAEVLYVMLKNFNNAALLAAVERAAEGYTPGDHNKGLALDFVRGGLFSKGDMQPIPAEVPGSDNDMDDIIDRWVKEVQGSEGAYVAAFGQRWGPEAGKPDQYFHFSPGNGIHDIHMNQGNSGRFVKDDGVWQDGGLLFRCADGTWSAVFIAFQSQSWSTDNQTGHTIHGGAGGHGGGAAPQAQKPGDFVHPGDHNDHRGHDDHGHEHHGHGHHHKDHHHHHHG